MVVHNHLSKFILLNDKSEQSANYERWLFTKSHAKFLASKILLALLPKEKNREVLQFTQRIKKQ